MYVNYSTYNFLTKIVNGGVALTAITRKVDKINENGKKGWKEE